MGVVYATQQYVEVLYKTTISHNVSATGSISIAAGATVNGCFGAGGSETLAIAAESVGWTYDTYDETVSADLTLDVTASATRAVTGGAAAVLSFGAAASVQCVFDRSCEAHVQAITSELDTTTYEMVDVIEGLDCDATASRPISVSAHQAIPLFVSAAKVRVKPDAIDVSADATLSLNCAAAKNQYGSALAWVLLDAEASVDKCSVVVAAVMPVASASVTHTTAQAATASIDTEVSVTYVIESSGIEFEYHPFVGAGAEDAPTPPSTTPPATLDTTIPFQLYYPATGTPTDSLLLRTPQFGNRERLSFNRINQETRGGTLLVYADPQWPKTQTLVLSFAGLTSSEAKGLLTFMETYLGYEIGLLDWEHRYWRGVITRPDAVVQDSRDSYSASFEFEGELDPTWTL